MTASPKVIVPTPLGWPVQTAPRAWWEAFQESRQEGYGGTFDEWLDMRRERGSFPFEEKDAILAVAKAGWALVEQAQDILATYLDPGAASIQTEHEAVNALLGLLDNSAVVNRAASARILLDATAQEHLITEDQIKHMADRFLSWNLPDDFSPDAGITFDRGKGRPTGTNLFDATQAEAMVRYMLAGLP